MKFSKQVLTLMAALAAGSASAAGTLSGTNITNVATASFTDPAAAPGAPLATKDSNPVVTTVLPKSGYDIVYQDGSADGTTAAAPAASYDRVNVLPGSNVNTVYTITNLGNVNGQIVKVDANVTGTATNTGAGTSGSGVTLSAASVSYYLDKNNNGVIDAGDTLITAAGVPVPADDLSTVADEGKVQIIQRIIIPALAQATDQFSASPQGTSAVFDAGTGTNPQVQEVAPPTALSDLQYTRATVSTPALVVVPPATIPGGAAPAAPVAGTPTAPPSNAPLGNTYLPPVNTGYPNNPGTVTVVNAATGNQDAYPKADADTLDDVVTFVGQVKNNGTLADTIKIKLPATLPTGATSLTVLDVNGNVLTPDGAGLYTLPGPVAPGASVEFQLVVKYTDPETSTVASTDVRVPVEVFSGNVPSATPLSTGTFRVHPPELLFGDTNAVAGGDPSTTPAPVQTVTPNGTFATTTPLTNTDSSAVFPVSVKNNGTYTEAYTLVGSVPIKLTNGNTVSVPVKYYKLDGTLLVGGVTDPIAAGNVGNPANFYAVVDVPVAGAQIPGQPAGTVYPASAAATTGATGSNPNPVLTQTATGNFSGATVTDGNDQIAVTYLGGITVDKYVGVNAAPTLDAAGKNAKSALPGDTLNFAIVAKNTYNGPVSNFILKDFDAAATGTNVYANSIYQAASTGVVLSGFAVGATPYYSSDSGLTWNAGAPNTVTAASGVWVYINTDGSLGANNAPEATDLVPSNASIQLNLGFKIK
jgi:hypothetical protein